MSTSSSSSTPPPFNAQQLIVDLARLTKQFKEWLETEPEIGLMDQISINNHLSMLYMSYGTWKTKCGPGAS